MGLLPLSTALLANPFLACSLLIPDLLPFFMGVHRSYLRSLFFSLFRAPVGRLFGRPLLRSVTPWPAFLPPGLFFALCAVRRSPRRLFCCPTSASGAFMSAGLRPPFLGLLFPDRSLPWPPCACVTSLAALYAAFLAAWRTGSLAPLCAASLAARCTACLTTRRAGSLAAQCAACFAAHCAACFAARCVACFAAPCAASLAASRAAFLDAPYVDSLPARPVTSLAAQAGPPSASVFSRLPLPFKGAFFLLISWPGLSRWPPPYTGFSLLYFFSGFAFVWLPRLGSFTRLALQAWGHWHCVYFHRPLGPFGYWKQGNMSPQTDGSAVCRYAYWSMKWLYLQRARSQSVVWFPPHSPDTRSPGPSCSSTFKVITLRQYTTLYSLLYWNIIALKCA